MGDIKFLLSAFFLASFPVFAQDSPQYHACSEKAKTQTEMNACASQEAARTDTELGETYQKLLSRIALGPDVIAKVKAAEEAWVAYRDAYMDAMYPAKNKQAEYGSIYPTDSDLLRAKLTQRQVRALEELLDHQRGPEQSAIKASTGVDPIVVSASVPFYPAAALLAHIQGTATIHVITDGKKVTDVASASGPPMLVAAAQDNIRSWKLMPHKPTTFVASFRYQIDEPPNCEAGNATVKLHMPSEVQISTAAVHTCDPV